MTRWGLPLAERFSRFVEPEPNSGCWLWIGSRHGKGYGHFRTAHGAVEKAHRVAWRLFVGQIPDGKQVLHRCDVPSCVNPSHLFLGTNADNLADRQAKQRQARGSRVWTVRLSEESVRYIRNLAELFTRAAIAERFGVSKSTVRGILTRKTWTHVLTALLCWTVMGSSVGVIDADTFVARLRIWPGLEAIERVRLLGVDAPEARTPKGPAATAFTHRWLEQAGDRLTVRTCKRDAFGRLLADVGRPASLGGEGDLARDLLRAGHAIPRAR